MGRAQYAKKFQIMSIAMQSVVNPDLMVLNPHSKVILFISPADDSPTDFPAAPKERFCCLVWQGVEFIPN